MVSSGLVLSLVLMVNAEAKQEIATNDTVRQTLNETVAFHKSHSVMSENQYRLHGLLNAFLTGDLLSIKALSLEISSSLEKITPFLPTSADDSESEGWKAVAAVNNISEEIVKSVDRENYERAYNHYTQLIFQCIKCHQAVRPYGKFPAPKPKKPKAESKDESATPP